MKKTYWVRTLVSLLALISLSVAYILRNQLLFGICDQPYQTDLYIGCLDRDAVTIGYPLLLFGAALLFVSLFLFFVSDIVFAYWFVFAFIWLVVSLLWIAAAPTYDSGFFSMMNFTKGIVARLMSILFVPISLGILLFASWKEKKSDD